MKPIDLQLGDDVIVKGCFYPTKDPVYLREDLLEIDLPSGLTIDVGWYPEGDPKGAYRIVVFQGYWVRQVIEPITTPETDRAVQVIRSLCSMFAAPRLSSSSSSGIVTMSYTVPPFRAFRQVVIPRLPPTSLKTFTVPVRNEITICSTSSQLPRREYALS